MKARGLVSIAVSLLFVATCQPLLSQQLQPLDTSQSSHKSKTEKDDINAIGSRNVGGSRAGDWYSLESEIEMGQQYSRLIDSEVKLLQDPMITEYVNRLGQNLVRNSDANVPFTIKVIDSQEVNAFSLPGGFLYVHSGLIVAADSEAELAGAMAHEIAHVAARHATRRMTRSNLINLLSIPLIFMGGVGMAIQSVTSLAVPLSFSKFSRSFEAEADYLGLEYLYAAGYDPEALISFFEKVQAMEHGKPGTLSKAFASHPQTADRVRKSQTEIATILPVREEYVVNTSEFDSVKTRLIATENRGQRRAGILNGPVLRRKADRPDSDDSDAPSDEPPVLRRRNYR